MVQEKVLEEKEILSAQLADLSEILKKAARTNP
jgi:hypothetical protein